MNKILYIDNDEFNIAKAGYISFGIQLFINDKSVQINTGDTALINIYNNEVLVLTKALTYDRFYKKLSIDLDETETDIDEKKYEYEVILTKNSKEYIFKDYTLNVY